ncbi:MAG: hypothetical protein AABY07_10830 [Nanoarchaeota archaeon]
MSIYNRDYNSISTNRNITTDNGKNITNPSTERGQLAKVNTTIYNHLLWTDAISSQSVWQVTAAVTKASVTDNTDFFTTSYNKITIALPNNSEMLYQNIIFSPSIGQAHFSMWLKSDTGETRNAILAIRNNTTLNEVTSNIVIKDYWQYYVFTRTEANMTDLRFGIKCNEADNIFIYGPQVISETNNLRRYLISTATKGKYKTMTQIQRFAMYEVTTNPAATQMKETSVATTAKMLEY